MAFLIAGACHCSGKEENIPLVELGTKVNKSLHIMLPPFHVAYIGKTGGITKRSRYRAFLDRGG